MVGGQVADRGEPCREGAGHRGSRDPSGQESGQAPASRAATGEAVNHKAEPEGAGIEAVGGGAALGERPEATAEGRGRRARGSGRCRRQARGQAGRAGPGRWWWCSLVQMRRNGQRRQRPGGAGCSALGDASGVRCGRASLPPVTVGAGCVTRGEDGPSIPKSPCVAIVPGIATICEDAQGSEIAGWAATAPQPPAAPGPGDRRGWQGGIGAERLGGPHDQMRCIFPEAFGIPAPNAPRFSGWRIEGGAPTRPP